MSLPMINKSKYTARAIGCLFGKAKAGSYQIAVPFRVMDGEHANEEITWIGHFTEKTEARTLESIDYLGWTGDDISELGELDEAGATRLLPATVEIVCEIEADLDGVDQLKVRWVNKIGAGKFAFKEPLVGQELKAFAAQMRGTIRNGRSNPAPRTAAPRQTQSASRQVTSGQHPNAPGSQDDIPF